MAAIFVRARCEDTGAVAALPKPALDAGMLPGWAEVAGPPPAGPKPATFPRPTTGEQEPTTDTAGTTAGTESADSSATEKE